MQLLQHKLVRFGIVGGGTALAYVLLYLTFLAVDLPQVLANGLAFLMAVMLQYVGQAAFTFGRQLNHRGQILRFAAMVVLGFGSSALITAVLPTMTGMSDWAAAAIVTVYLPIQNFIFMTLWVFASHHSETEITS
jgi:putative flippase GtrA